MSTVTSHMSSPSPSSQADETLGSSRSDTSASARASKNSLGFILSPASSSRRRPRLPSPPMDPIAAPIYRTAPPRPKSKASLSKLEALPRDVLALIAFNLVVSPANPGYRPSPLILLLLTSHSIHDAVCFESNPQLYNRLFRTTFDTTALDRRYHWMVRHMATMAGRGRAVFDLFSDPKSWAIDYKTRWGQARRMRKIAKAGTLNIPGTSSIEQLLPDLWNVWFLLTENDGRNMSFLAEQCAFRQWMYIGYREEMLSDALAPGYPKETGAKALGMWCALIAGEDQDLGIEQTPEEVDERVFVLRPFVFACAKYDVTYAPWHHRRLPMCESSCTDDHNDVTLKSKALPYTRFGYTWRRAPPHFILGCYTIFLRLLDGQPKRRYGPGSSTFSPSSAGAPKPGLFSFTRILPSIYHDREWQRNSVCQDPHTSPGLPPLTFRGDIEGFWRAKFLFYDFDVYRQLLAGDMRAAYTGSFADQAAELELKETVIKVRLEDVGGKGSMLCAGFDDTGVQDKEEEQQRVLAGYGHEVITDETVADEPGWTKEILISGRARTSWGPCLVRGRVRAWDGLINMSIAYTPPCQGRWLWRGYIHTGGHLIGRWRDTFTPEHLRGYEGPFGMVRAGDVFYPPHFPRRMSESQGLADAALPGLDNTPFYPSMSLISGGTPQSIDARVNAGALQQAAAANSVGLSGWPSPSASDGRTGSEGSENGGAASR